MALDGVAFVGEPSDGQERGRAERETSKQRGRRKGKGWKPSSVSDKGRPDMGVVTGVGR
jgi:hypothetical protein